MKINAEKTKVVLFNTARKYEFMPQLTIDAITHLEVMEEFRLLGIHFMSIIPPFSEDRVYSRESLYRDDAL